MPSPHRQKGLRSRRAASLAALSISCAVALAVAGCTAAGGTSSGSTASAGSSSAQPSAVIPAAASAVRWHSCSVQGAGLQCASLQVPLNYARPGGRKITLALSRVAATAPASQQQGDLLVNPGGPGGSGRGLAAFVAQGLNPQVAADYNIIGFDPRGVGASVPALTCEPSFFSGVRPDYIPATAAAEQVLVSRAKNYAADCAKRYGWLLPYLTSQDVARDMDSIRAALGAPTISYFGYSYGTYLGQVYATLFPHRLRRMVLDSTVDPTGAWYADNIAQDYAFEGRMEAFFSWVAAHNATFRLGSTPAQVDKAWYRARAALQAHPADQVIGADDFDDTFLQGGYSNSLWPGLAAALATYLHSGATQQIISQYQQEGVQSENEFAVYNAVECSDVNWPRNWAKWNSDTRRVYRTAPFQAWDNAWFNAACAFWPVRGPAQPVQIKGAGLPGILMLQGTLDAATPYAGAQVAHRLLPTARMVVVEGGGNHGQSLAQPSNTCVDGYLNRYLATGALPSRPGLVNATCPALPPPALTG
ncbi:MAG TPA: alpha/beta hydrolase [Streptosporangiaceae bacterium]|nr:alpha/beta hydrolase [Streptosporangiaceae bacterium]